MPDPEVLVATNLWYTERRQLGAHNFILHIIPFLFDVLDSLYIETRKLPLYSISGITNKQIDNSHIITFGIFLSTEHYIILRNILSLMGDAYNLCVLR